MEQINDRIGEYLIPHLNDYVFDELSDAYLEKAGVSDIMSGVPVPVSKKDLSGITVLKLARSMAFVIGCDPNFKYRENYVQYILRNFDKRFAQGLLAEGMDGAEKNDYDYAVILFRAALIIDPDNGDAYYCYGRACRDAYERAEGDEASEDFVGRFKAEAMSAFELATIKSPLLADAYYYLGYAYVNMGLYIKAKLTWEEFIRLTGDRLTNNPPQDEKAVKELEDAYTEIGERLKQLEIPVRIEEGCNMVLAGKFEQGVVTLRGFTDGEFKTWWPLWYYMATAYEGMGAAAESEAGSPDEAAMAAYEEACRCFLEVLKLSPSNEETIRELAALYSRMGQGELASKYETKLRIVQENRELDREEKRAAMGNKGKFN